MPSLAHLPFVSAWCALVPQTSPDRHRLIFYGAKELMDDAVLSSLVTASGAPDVALVASILDAELADRAAAAPSPLPPSSLASVASPTYSHYQAALLAFRSFMRASQAASAPPPPTVPTGEPPHVPPPPFTASAPGTGSGIAKSCPADSRSAATAGALLLDKVAWSARTLQELRELDARAVTCNEAQLSAELAAASADVTALVAVNFDHIDVAPLAREASLFARNIARRASKGARSAIKENEEFLVNSTIQPNPQIDTLMKRISDGSLHKISEYDLTGAPDAHKNKLFSGTAHLYDYVQMQARVDAVMQAFARHHHQQATLVAEFLLAYKRLA